MSNDNTDTQSYPDEVSDVKEESLHEVDDADVNKSFASDTGTPQNVVKRFNWEYGAYDVYRFIRNFFRGEPIPRKNLNKFSDLAETLISSIPDDPSSELLNASGKLLEQQRMLEDTRARRRLEKWATRVIVWYLLFVFFLIIANGLVLIFHPIETVEMMGHVTGPISRGFISDSIMTIILSTTTINIIGLGIIVLKGHFPQRDKNEKKSKD